MLEQQEKQCKTNICLVCDVCVRSLYNINLLVKVGINSKQCCGATAMSWRSGMNCFDYNDKS